MVLISLTCSLHPLPMVRSLTEAQPWVFSHQMSKAECLSPAHTQKCLCLSRDLVDLDPLISQLDLRPSSSLWTCLVITGLCLAIISLARPDPDLWIHFLAWGRTCLISTELSDALDSRLRLAATPRPALPASLEGCGVCPDWWGPWHCSHIIPVSSLCLWEQTVPAAPWHDPNTPPCLPCLHSTKGRKRNAVYVNLIREHRQREIRYQLRLELFFVLCFKHVLPPTSHWRWQHCLPQHKAAARDSEEVIEGGSCSAAVSLENNKYWLTREEARGIRL